MLDVTDKTATHAPPKDFQEHLALLEAQGLIVRIDRPIDKNTELHPLVRLAVPGRDEGGCAAPFCSPT
jgi:4-hydroxy-3-polyprenylbenzoate decarboxylase